MSTFRFRLAPVLRLREVARDERRGELAEALRIEQRILDQLDELRKTREAERLARSQMTQRGPVNVDRLLEGTRYELVLAGQEQALLRQLQAVSAEVERRRLALVEADREVRALEKLREKHEERHHQEELRFEARALDEISTWPRDREAS